MLERIMSGLMALWMALSPAHSDAGQTETGPESTAVVIEAETEQQDTAEQTPALTLEDVRGVTFSDSPADAADACAAETLSRERMTLPKLSLRDSGPIMRRLLPLRAITRSRVSFLSSRVRTPSKRLPRLLSRRLRRKHDRSQDRT